MRIKSVEIKNYRCIKEGNVECDNLTALVGRNGVGKSAFLSAINIFFELSSEIDEEDFFNRDYSQSIEIKLTFNEIKSYEKEEFKKFISGEELIVIKRISYEEGEQYFGIINQIPEFADIRNSKNKTELRKNYKEICEAGGWDELDPNVRSAHEAQKQMENYENNHPELTKSIECINPFFGAKNVGGGKLDNFTKLVFVPAVHEASDEVSGRKGAVQQLIDTIILKKIINCEEMTSTQRRIREEIVKLFDSNEFRAIKDLGEEMSSVLENYAPGSSMELDWGDIDIPKVEFPSPQVTLVEDEFGGEIERKGHGLQRALILSLLQYMATVTHIEEMKETSIKSKIESPDLIIVIEEPELYLHPSRARYLSNTLMSLAYPSNTRHSNTQIIYSTHSPYFISMKSFEQIRILRKIKVGKDLIPQTIIKKYNLDDLVKESSFIHEEVVTDYCIDGFIARSIPIMNSIVSEGFFSNTAIVVEGLSEIGILWKLQEILELNWEEKGIVMIPASSKNNIDRPVLIFRGLGIPTFFIFDGDKQNETNNQKKSTIVINAKLLLLAGAEKLEFPETSINESWAVFEYKIEKEIEQELSRTLFDKFREDVSAKLGYNEPSRVLKNVEGASMFIQTVYDNKKKLNLLEELVLRIDGFYSDNVVMGK